jgi:hypothetical protein
VLNSNNNNSAPDAYIKGDAWNLSLGKPTHKKAAIVDKQCQLSRARNCDQPSYTQATSHTTYHLNVRVCCQGTQDSHVPILLNPVKPVRTTARILNKRHTCGKVHMHLYRAFRPLQRIDTFSIRSSLGYYVLIIKSIFASIFRCQSGSPQQQGIHWHRGSYIHKEFLCSQTQGYSCLSFPTNPQKCMMQSANSIAHLESCQTNQCCFEDPSSPMSSKGKAPMEWIQSAVASR